MTIRAGVGVLCILGATVVGSISDGPPAPPTALRMGEDRVSYAERYDAWLSTIPETDRAWETVKSVSEAIEQLGLSDAEIVKARPELIDRLHTLVELPVLGMPTAELGVSPDDDPEDIKLLLGLLLPHLHMLRANAGLLSVDAALTENPSQALLDLKAILRTEQYCFVTDIMIESLFAARIDSRACDLVLKDRIKLDLWDDRDLTKLARVFDKKLVWEPPSRSLNSELVFIDNFFDWIYEDSENGMLGEKGAARLKDISSDFESMKDLTIEQIKTEVTNRFEQEELIASFWEAAKMDLAGSIKGKDDFLTTRILQSAVFDRQWAGIVLLPVAVILPATDRYAAQMYETTTKRGATRLMIAVYRYRARHGEFPKSVAEIDDDLLQQSPIDPYTDKPLRIRIEDERVVIYSLGPDLDDDQGRALSEHRIMLRAEYEGFDEQQLQDWDGDWVLTAPN